MGDENENCRCHLLNTDRTYGSTFAGCCPTKNNKSLPRGNGAPTKLPIKRAASQKSPTWINVGQVALPLSRRLLRHHQLLPLQALEQPLLQLGQARLLQDKRRSRRAKRNGAPTKLPIKRAASQKSPTWINVGQVALPLSRLLLRLHLLRPVQRLPLRLHQHPLRLGLHQPQRLDRLGRRLRLLPDLLHLRRTRLPVPTSLQLRRKQRLAAHPIPWCGRISNHTSTTLVDPGIMGPRKMVHICARATQWQEVSALQRMRSILDPHMDQS